MSLFRELARGYVRSRLLGSSRHRRHGGWPSSYGPASPFGSPRYARRGRQRGGFGFWGPFPSYSTRTRRGSRVRVSGCCLPIPLAMALGGGVAARALTRR